MNLLQFGHGFTAVENGLHRSQFESAGIASIRPRLHRRGKLFARGSGRSRLARFNSATASPPWKTREESTTMRPHRELQFGHGFTAVENPSFLVLTRSSRHRFNSATASPPWKTRLALGALSDTSTGFNSATASPPWKMSRKCAVNLPGWCFKSATASPPWKTRSQRGDNST